MSRRRQDDRVRSTLRRAIGYAERAMAIRFRKSHKGETMRQRGIQAGRILVAIIAALVASLWAGGEELMTRANRTTIGASSCTTSLVLMACLRIDQTPCNMGFTRHRCHTTEGSHMCQPSGSSNWVCYDPTDYWCQPGWDSKLNMNDPACDEFDPPM